MTEDATRVKMRARLPSWQQMLDGPPDLAPHVYYEALRDASDLILESLSNWAGIRKLAPLEGLDPGIAPWVELLRAHHVETFESCQGGEDPDRPGRGHAYPEPTIAFGGGPEAGFRAYAIAITHALPVACIQRVWKHTDHELTGPEWEIVFTRQATAREAVEITAALAFERGEQ